MSIDSHAQDVGTGHVRRADVPGESITLLPVGRMRAVTGASAPAPA